MSGLNSVQLHHRGATILYRTEARLGIIGRGWAIWSVDGCVSIEIDASGSLARNHFLAVIRNTGKSRSLPPSTGLRTVWAVMSSILPKPIRTSCDLSSARSKPW